MGKENPFPCPALNQNLVTWPLSARAVFTRACPIGHVPGPCNCPCPPSCSASLPFVRSRTVAPCPVPQVGVSLVSCGWGPTCSQGPPMPSCRPMSQTPRSRAQRPPHSSPPSSPPPPPPPPPCSLAVKTSKVQRPQRQHHIQDTVSRDAVSLRACVANVLLCVANVFHHIRDTVSLRAWSLGVGAYDQNHRGS